MRSLAVGLRRWCGFAAIFFAVIAVILMGEFSQGDEDDGGLGGLNSEHIFAYHPLLMTLGMIMFSVIALQSYAILPLSHSIQKFVHVVAHSCAITCFGIGLRCVVKSHNDNLLPNLNSMHSWVGLAAAVVYVQQYLLGFLFFLSGTQTRNVIRNYMSSHLSLGIFALCLSMAAAVSGIAEMKKCTYAVTSPDTNPASHYEDMSAGCKLVQGAGVCIMVSVLFSVYSLVPERYRGNKQGYSNSDGSNGNGSEYIPPDAVGTPLVP